MIEVMGAAGAVALLVWAAADSPERRWAERLAAGPPGTGRHGRRALTPRISAITVAAVLVAGLAGGRPALTAALVVALAGGTGARLAGRARRRRRARQASIEIARAADELAGLLRVGGAPAAALTRVAEECPALADAAALHAMGGDPVVALREGAALPGQEGLGALAAAWQVAVRTGAPMGTALTAIADELARREDLRGVVAVELSATRAAGVLLAGLPVVGLALGQLLRADPVGFLTRELVGQVCLVLAVALVCAGLLWTDALTQRVLK